MTEENSPRIGVLSASDRKNPDELFRDCKAWGHLRQAFHAAVVVVGKGPMMLGKGRPMIVEALWVEVTTPPEGVQPITVALEDQKQRLAHILRMGRAVGYVGVGVGKQGEDYTRHMAEIYRDENTATTRQLLQGVLEAIGADPKQVKTGGWVRV